MYRKVAIVASHSRPGLEHSVQFNSAGNTFACTCEAWQYRHKQRGNCKHILQVCAFQLFGNEWWKREDIPPVLLTEEEL